MYRVEVIQNEMASAVRVLGGDGPAKEQISKASRITGLAVSMIERLRWKKIKRVPADVADTIREALERYDEETRSRAKHLLWLAQQENEALLNLLTVTFSLISLSSYRVADWCQKLAKQENNHD